MCQELMMKFREVFAKYDVAGIGVIENNLPDEYDIEIELLIENIPNMEMSVNGTYELLEFIFNESFAPTMVMIPEEFAKEIYEIVN